MISKSQRKRNLIIFACLLSFLIMFTAFTNLNLMPWMLSGNNAINNEINDMQYLKNQALTSDNSLTGIGSPWNVTHWANRTDEDLDVFFDEGSMGTAQIPIYSGWQGYDLNTEIRNLYDTRNWNNGTFSYGSDNGYITGANDSTWIQNDFQNWTFHRTFVGQANVMSGNYIDATETTPNPLNQDCIELRMAGNLYNNSGSPTWYRYWYDTGDQCWWDSTFHIPRGEVLNSILNFQINPIHLISFNSWEVTVSINNVQVYTIGLYTLKQMGINTWHSFSIPQGLWSNTSNVYTTPHLDDSDITVKITLIYSATSAGYGFEDGENRDYQQVLIDNVQLITKAEAYPSDIQLNLNNTAVQDVEWGAGTLDLSNTWNSDAGNVEAIFSSLDNGLLGAYHIDLKAKLNLFVIKETPDTIYETNIASLGTSFSVENNSNVNWQCYSRINVPTRYEETLMRIEFPQDLNITAVYDPQNPTLNILNLCDNSTAGRIDLELNTISATPDGFWKLLGESPNYCEALNIYNNKSGHWELSTTFSSGESVNITSTITNNALVSSYIDQTSALLQVRFPNGSIWDQQTQMALVDSNGIVKFTPFSIPSSPSYYVEGEYQAIVIWNNSYSSYRFNETGIIYKQFVVIHDSLLTPENTYYQDKFQNTIVNLKVTFQDLITSAPIQNAHVYTFEFGSPTNMLDFGEISPGFYFLEFNITGASLGNNTLTIHANSTYFINQIVDVKIEVIKKTELHVSNDFFEAVQYRQNFTVQVDYLDNETGFGIVNPNMTTDWKGEYQFVSIGPGSYNLICNTSDPDYAAGKLYDFNIYADAYTYESQQVTIRVFITELNSTIALKVNGTSISPNGVYVVEVSQKVNITVEYRDISNAHISNATVSIVGASYSDYLDENELAEHYSILLDASDFGQGIDNFLIYAEKMNYKPNSIPFIFEITERQTNLQIFMNGMNKTLDPTIDLTITTVLNLTVKFTDILGKHISGAQVQLSGDYTSNLIENPALEQYFITINTTQLNVGVRLIKLSVHKTNYESQSRDLRIQIRRIGAEIRPVSGSSIITIRPGEYTTLKVRLYDSFNQTIIGASVNYSWAFNPNGILTDPGNNGTYEARIGDVLDGSYIIVISATYGDNYDIQSYQITLTVYRDPIEVFIFQILLISAIVAAIVVAGYLILYWKVLRFPKPIRRVKKFGRSLRFKKPPRVDVVQREKAFKASFETELSGSSKFLKGKPSTELTKVDKLLKANELKDQTDLINSRGDQE